MSWPDAQQLQAYGDRARLGDDRGRAVLGLRYLYPHTTERYVEIVDRQTNAHGVVRFFCPLAGGGIRPHTLQALYALQGALLRDANLSLFKPDRKFPDYKAPLQQTHLVAESGHGGVTLERFKGTWLRLTVSTDRDLHNRARATASACFNKQASPHVYEALCQLGKAMRRDLSNSSYSLRGMLNDVR